MGKRALQLVIVALLGAMLGWLLLREDETSAAPPPDRPAPRPSIQVEELPPAAAVPDEKPRDFNLPKMVPPAPELPEEKLPAAFQVPKEWHLRGSASKNYELRSDREFVFSGNYSALLRSHQKDIQPNLTGSAVQAVLAAPYVGTRVELTATLRSESASPYGNSVWIYVTDPARVVIAYQLAQMVPTTAKGEWKRYRVVMDVPWHGEVIAYGFSLMGAGKLWADDVKLTPVDINVPVTGRQNSHQLGVIAQAVSLDSALANPTNLDFEDVMTTTERQPDAPPDAIKGTRF